VRTSGSNFTAATSFAAFAANVEFDLGSPNTLLLKMFSIKMDVI